MSYFQLIAGGDELRAVPKACSRFDGHAVDRRCNEEGNPAYKVVYGFVLFHSDEIRYNSVLFFTSCFAIRLVNVLAYMGANIMISLLNR